MGWWHGWIDRLRTLVFRGAEERALDEEIRFHIERETERLLAGGMGPEEARREAHRRFGGVERAKERTRDERGTRTLEDTTRDVRHAFRALLRTPGPTAAAVLTLGLGVGATTSMFSVLDGVLLRPLPYGEVGPAGERVVVREVSEDGRELPASYWNFDDWRRDVASFDALAAYTGAASTTVLTASDGARARTSRVSADFFDVLGVPPILGRLPGPDENRPGGPPVAVVSEGFWRESLGAPAPLDGVSLNLDGERWDVVGVLPDRADLPEGAELWVSLDRRVPWSARANHVVDVVGRLAPGATLERARDELQASHRGIREAHPDVESVGVRVRPLEEEILGEVRRPVILLMGAAGFLLLVACTNVASTLLARGMGRRRELAVRASLGAGRGRLVRQLFTESVVLSGLGGLLALGVAWGLLRAAAVLDPGAVPRLAEAGLDGRVLLFAGAAAVLTAVAFGLLPAVQLTRGTLSSPLRSGRGSDADRRVRGTWRILVAGEVALALVLLTGAGLTLRSLSAILTRDVGFDPDGVATARVHLPLERYGSGGDALAFLDELLGDLRSAPGVRAAGLNVLPPVRGWGSLGSPVHLEGGGRTDAAFQYRVADAGYFDALDVPLLRGRLFDERDGPDAPHAAVVDEVMAARVWPGENPIGQRFNPRGMDPYPDEWLTVVGVVGEVRTWSQDPGDNPTFYVAYRQRPAFLAMLGASIVAEGGDLEGLQATLRDAVRAVDSDVPARVATLRSHVADSAADRRFTGFVLGTFAVIALLLAAAGVYGVVSYTVARRTREIGIRMAIGASPSAVRARVQGEALILVGLGAAGGLVASGALSRFLESVLFDVGPLDPWTYAGTTALLLASAAVASWIPARRSTRVDPVVTLRAD